MNVLARVVRELRAYANHDASGGQVAELAAKLLANMAAHNPRFDRERFERAAEIGKPIPIVELKGREVSVRLVSPTEADRLETEGEIVRQSGLALRRARG